VKPFLYSSYRCPQRIVDVVGFHLIELDRDGGGRKGERNMAIRNLTMGDCMSQVPVTIDAGLTMDDAAQRMFDHKIRHLPVVDRGHLVGVVSERDLAMIDSIPNVDRQSMSVATAMSSNPYTCSKATPLVEVVDTMADQKIGTAIVMESGKIVGIFTTIDALRYLADALRGK